LGPFFLAQIKSKSLHGRTTNFVSQKGPFWLKGEFAALNALRAVALLRWTKKRLMGVFFAFTNFVIF
jgi:hypothetical protein